jgi:hypothetical protein
MNEDQLRDKHSETTNHLRRELLEKDAILEAYKQDHGKLEVLFNRIESAITPVQKLPFLGYDFSKAVSSSNCVAVLQVSDAHMGAVQEPTEIEGFGEYNPDISWKRQIDFVLLFLDWVEMHRGSYNIKECVLIATGDLISGDIHQELQVTNAFPTPVQVVKAAQVLTRQVQLLSQKFDKVTVEFVSEDNHARLTKKPQAKEAGMNSFNYIVGKMASIYLKDIDNVVFNLYPMYEKVIHVLNRQYLVCHGHGLVGWMGIPWYSIQRHLGKESSARLQVIMDDINKSKQVGFHKYIFGHYHTPFDNELYSCCGSVSGTDAYDHKSGRYGIPSQSAWMVHPKHGEFDRINFKLSTTRYDTIPFEGF